jgi:hypothetical protein
VTNLWQANPVELPVLLAERVGPDTAKRFRGVGNLELIDEPLLGLLASRECPGHVLLETLDCVPGWVNAGQSSSAAFTPHWSNRYCARCCVAMAAS